jgi:hypothetical protein
MDHIYSSARLTIVAGPGFDALAGLPGAGANLVPRYTAQLYGKVQGLEAVTAHKSYQDWLSSSSWDTRAWTYQEKWCSKRLLIFTKEREYFHSECALWYEDLAFDDFAAAGGKILDYEKSGQEMFSEPFNAYTEILNGFVLRSISFEKDLLRAVRGLEGYLAPSLGQFFIFGLPVAKFDLQICWGVPSLVRRQMDFLSWSWAGWDFWYNL